MGLGKKHALQSGNFAHRWFRAPIAERERSKDVDVSRNQLAD